MKTVTNMKTNEESERIRTDIQYDFFFWLGAEGEITSVSEEEFQMKQDTWGGQRPNKGA